MLCGRREVNSNMVTIYMGGIYAVGDICMYEEKIKLITTGFGEAARLLQ